MKNLFSGKHFLLLLLFYIPFKNSLCQSVNISAGNTITQNFDGMGTNANAVTPSGWKVDKLTTVRLVGAYPTGVNTITDARGGNNMSSTAGNGKYNFGAGDPTISTDRAVGGLSSGTASQSVNVYVDLLNNGSVNIPSFTISYNVEKYRNGSNSAGFSIQMYYSTDGINWTSAGADFLTSFAADANNNGFTTAPGATSSVTSKTLAVSLSASSHLYLAWNYSVTSGTTTTNAQALGIDDVSIATPGAALNFDGTDDYVDIANSTSLNSYLTSGEITIEYWINPGIATANNRDIISKRFSNNTGGFVFEADPNSLTYHHYIYTSGGYIWADATYTANTWQHIAVTARQGDAMRVYKNGVLQNTTSLAGVTFTSSTTAIRLMAANASNTFFQNGSLDELRIWNRALCQGEITNNMNCEIQSTGNGLVANYHFNQGVAGGNNAGVTTANDASGNANNGTLNNFALTGATSNWVAPGGVTSAVSCTPLPGISINDVSQAEGNSGSTNFVFTVTLSSPAPAGGVSVDFTTADGTAGGTGGGGNDYTTSSGTVTITAGNTSTTISIPVLGDVIPEPNETFFVNLSNVCNATITDAQGMGTITNDDGVLSNNADLSNLTISAGTLTPAFTPGNINYTDPVANSVSSVTVTPTAADAGATIKVNGTPVASGTPSLPPIPLTVGHNNIFVQVTAQNGTTSKTYFIDVIREAATPTGNNWYVNDNSQTGDRFTSAIGNNGNPGTALLPFATMNHAMAVAGLGDNIYVDAGTYTENVIVTKSLKFYGSNYDVSPNGGSRIGEAIVNAPLGSTAEATRVFDVYTPGTSVEIKGFKLMNGRPLSDGHRGRSATNDITVLFEKNWVQNGDNLFCGTLTTWKNVTITDNFFDAINRTGSSSAIQLNDAPTALSGPYTSSVVATITDNVITATTWAGILCDNIASASILRNKISNVTGEAGIQLAGGMGTATVSQNEITNTNSSSAALADDGAIKIYGSQFTGAVNIINNTVSNALNGFVVKNAENITGKNIHVNNNSFTPATRFTVYNAGTGNLDAMCNWHGSTTYAVVAARISGNVTFIPYLTIGTDVSGAPGFQPDPNPLNCSGNTATPIANPVVNKEFSLYPVPAGDMLNIKYESPKQQQVSILVIDEAGRIMQKENMVVMKGMNIISLSVKKLYKGIYTVILTDSKTQSHQKMIKL